MVSNMIVLRAKGTLAPLLALYSVCSACAQFPQQGWPGCMDEDDCLVAARLPPEAMQLISNSWVFLRLQGGRTPHRLAIHSSAE